MANSKANIYPIQLQGAELNLNKYDAEIKQYSGFNKNNSPYVGGGLSPIFTKDEHIEGSTPENTYIDTNGDVYRVDTSGLYRNDEKVIFYQSVNQFFSCKKILEEDNLIKAYSDKILLKAEENVSNTSYKINGVSVGYHQNNKGLSLSECVDHYINVVFDTINNVHCCIVSFGLSRITIFNADTGELITSINISYAPNISNFREDDMPFRILKNSGSTKILIIGGGETYDVGYSLFFVKFTFNGSTISYNGYKRCGSSSGVIQFDDTSTIQKSVFSNKVNDYLFLAAPANKMKIRYVQNQAASNYFITQFSLDCDYIFDTVDSDTLHVKYTWANSVFFTTAVDVINSTVTNLFLKQIYKQNSNYSIFYLDEFQFESSSGMVKPNNVGCITLETIQVNNNEQSIARVKCGCFQNIGIYRVLFNNGFLSGIASVYDVLLSNWNTVDINTITVDLTNDSICFKDGNDWCYITLGTPTLKKVNNQIITNANSAYNCFFLNTKQKGQYALAFNNRFYSGSNKQIFSKTQENDCYFCTSINEYKPNENSSILINPIPIFSLGEKFNNFSTSINRENFVNLYGGDSTDIKYIKSIYFEVHQNSTGTSVTTYTKTIHNKDLEGLPFPSDANGNVQYSPSLFSEIKSIYGNDALIKNGSTFYPLMKGNNNEPVMSFYLASGIDNLQEAFIVQGQHYGILNNGIYAISYDNGVLSGVNFVVDITGLKFCGNTPYQAIFFSETNRCLYSFSGANILNKMQFVDKFSRIDNYIYNPATQTNILFTDIGVIFLSLFGMFLLEVETSGCFLLENGVILYDDNGNYKYIRYYLKESDTDFTKQNIQLETCFYGMNDQTVTINDCLYFRLFSENHESGDIEVSATTLTNTGRKTEKTTFKIKSTDWDNMTHSIYLRYQPKAQRGLGISFSINSPFMIAALSVGSVPDTILVDKISKGAINAPEQTSNNVEW